MTTKLDEGDTVELRRSIDMPFGTLAYRSLLVVRSVMSSGRGKHEIQTHVNLERADGSLAVSCLSIDSVRPL